MGDSPAFAPHLPATMRALAGLNGLATMGLVQSNAHPALRQLEMYARGAVELAQSARSGRQLAGHLFLTCINQVRLASLRLRGYLIGMCDQQLNSLDTWLKPYVDLRHEYEHQDERRLGEKHQDRARLQVEGNAYVGTYSLGDSIGFGPNAVPIDEAAINTLKALTGAVFEQIQLEAEGAGVPLKHDYEGIPVLRP